jgi:hypothetical protein
MKKRKFNDGGSTDAEEAKYKAAGLAASNAENKSSGFLGLGRFLQGNIDEKGSEAYEKYGAGLGRKLAAENTQRGNEAPVVKSSPTVKATTTPAVSEDLKRKDRQEDGPVKTVAKPVETKMAPDASQAPLGPSDTAAMKRVASSVAKPTTSGSSAAPVKQSAIAKAFSETRSFSRSSYRGTFSRRRRGRRRR